MDVSDGIDKSWDYPWTTEEMRKKRREWSLAGDVGLLKHLQQFSENLTSKANKTQTTLDTLTTQLKETGILVDNVTNTSLALANTQFIESRVQDDDIEKNPEEDDDKQENLQTQMPENLIASISKSVKQGLNIMDEKYKVMDVACSDSEEDDSGAIVFSVIVEPNDPYQDRSLPYIIGSDKWIASNKIGLESSSSESEQQEEEREESESDKEDTSAQKIFNSRHNAGINIARLSSSSSDSDNYDDASNNISYMNDKKMNRTSQNNINSTSESATPTSKISNETTPNFAEELARRLGTVQAQKPLIVDENSESSINRSKDDLFKPEKDEDVFNVKSEHLFDHKNELFDEQVSANLWKERATKIYKNNIIPPSIDVPPPISIVSTKPKSTIDDLFADADSEDSDDIFSSKNTLKEHTKKSSINNDVTSASMENIPKNVFNITTPDNKNVVTSISESNENVSKLFSDDENDDGDLFGVSKKQLHKITAVSSPTNTTQELNKKKLIGGVSIFGDTLASDIENKLSSRVIRQPSNSSDNDKLGNYDNVLSIEPTSGERNILNNNTITDYSSSVADKNLTKTVSSIIETSNSSDISIQPSSIDNTTESSLWINHHSGMSSMQLKSEEIYRESNDPFEEEHTCRPTNFSSISTSIDNQQQEQYEQNISSVPLQDDVFENDNLFSPPPLPSKSDSKRTKSKVSSLFDDSDSGDELFSATSSGSRSQKSTDFLVIPSSSEKTKPIHRGNSIFDENIDIFGNKDCPEVNIFGMTSKSKTKDVVSDGLFNDENDTIMSKSNNIDKLQNTGVESKNINLFDDDDNDDDLFCTKPKLKNKLNKTEIFEEEEEDSLFLSAKLSDKKHASVRKDMSISLKIDKTIPISDAETKTKISYAENELLANTARTHKLLFKDDDYEDLFGKKKIVTHEDDVLKSKPKKKITKYLIEQKSSEENGTLSSTLQQKPTIKSNAVLKSDISNEKNTYFENTSSVEEDTAVNSAIKINPPRTLNIRTVSTSPEENNQTPRRAVSGKIKSLMGKVGDLKILSPMNAPPLWRKSEDKTDEDEDVVDHDSGGLDISGHVSPPSISDDSVKKESSYSTISNASNTEVVINFDELTHVETLSTTASKSRVRIQAKRRPQSRHARKSALQQSGIDFDTANNIDNDPQEDGHASIFSHTFNRDSSAAFVNTNRLIVTDVQRIVDSFSGMDDKSELGSISKESSMSVNKNTLMSPSTDEEDLFDVPPDLPEDPQKEDTLFGRAPILSPVENTQSEKICVSPDESLVNNMIGKINQVETIVDVVNSESSQQIMNSENNYNEPTRLDTDASIMNILACEKDEDDKYKNVINEEQNEIKKDSSKEPNDPLRNSSHDPLKNPSQLFAFVTKTPSPEKSKDLLFSDDDSLFSSSMKEPSDKHPKKAILDLFTDDADGDLFSTPLKKTLKKPLRDTKINLFDDDDIQIDEDDNLFNNASNKAFTKPEIQKSNPVQIDRKKNNIFNNDDNDNDDDYDDDDDSNLFVESSNQSQKSDRISISETKHDFANSSQKDSNMKDIFDDLLCEDDDIFATKKTPKNIVPSKSLFALDDDENDSHIFGKPSISDSKTKTIASRSATSKKAVTKNLKMTTEKTVEDPLSLLQDD